MTFECSGDLCPEAHVYMRMASRHTVSQPGSNTQQAVCHYGAEFEACAPCSMLLFIIDMPKIHIGFLLSRFSSQQAAAVSTIRHGWPLCKEGDQNVLSASSS